jgi:hypothetical protein
VGRGRRRRRFHRRPGHKHSGEGEVTDRQRGTPRYIPIASSCIHVFIYIFIICVYLFL